MSNLQKIQTSCYYKSTTSDENNLQQYWTDDCWHERQKKKNYSNKIIKSVCTKENFLSLLCPIVFSPFDRTFDAYIIFFNIVYFSLNFCAQLQHTFDETCFTPCFHGGACRSHMPPCTFFSLNRLCGLCSTILMIGSCLYSYSQNITHTTTTNSIR